jgi:sugar/nucleoside kinase (ribokinase family)
MGCVGNDKLGEWFEERLLKEGVTPILHRDYSERTGVCASLVYKNERTLCTFLGACKRYPASHLFAHMESTLLKS